MRVLKFHDQFENTLVRSNVIGLSSETLMVPPPDRVGDLPLWTAQGVENWLYSYPQG